MPAKSKSTASKNSAAFDFQLDGGTFKAKWNLSEDGMLWIMKPESVREIGCIHTCQGLELDYVGVIIGPDLVVRNGKIVIVQSHDIQDPDTGGQYTVKVYRSEKTATEDSWSHSLIRLEPDSMDSKFKPLTLEPDTVNDLRMVGGVYRHY